MGRRIKYAVLGATCFLLGAALLEPAVAHVVSGSNAHTLNRHHESYFAGRTWADSRYVRRSTRYLTVHSSAFKPMDSTVAYSYTANGFLYSTSALGEFMAGVNLPQGARVRKVTLYYYDNDAGVNMNTNLIRSPLGSATNSAMAATDFSDDIGAGYSTTTSITNPVIDNLHYSYYLWVQTHNGGPNACFQAVRIEYTD